MPSLSLLRIGFAGLLAGAVLASCDSKRGFDPEGSDSGGNDSSQKWLDATVSAVRGELEILRGHAFDSAFTAVSVRRSSFDSLMAALNDLYGGGAGESYWEMNERTLVVLGLADSMGQWAEAQESFDESSILGFYLPQNRTLYVFDDGSEQDRVYTVVHEMEHVLQDQVFGLETIGSGVRETDEDAALTYAVEADAEYVATALLRGDTSAADMRSVVEDYAFTFDQLAMGLDSWAKSNAIPMAMALPQYAPYYMGYTLISERRVRSGWSGVDSLFAAPLRTTRAAILPSLSDTLRDWNPGGAPEVSGGFRPLQTGRLGALHLGSLVWGSLDSRLDLQDIAAGWRGDRFWTFHGDSGSGLLWRIAWQDTGTARAFARTWWNKRTARRAASGLAKFQVLTDTLRSASNVDRTRNATVRVRGSEVLVVEGFSATEAASLEARLAALGDRGIFAARGVAEGSFGTGEWRPPRPLVPFHPPRGVGTKR